MCGLASRLENIASRLENIASIKGLSPPPPPLMNFVDPYNDARDANSSGPLGTLLRVVTSALHLTYIYFKGLSLPPYEFC